MAFQYEVDVIRGAIEDAITYIDEQEEYGGNDLISDLQLALRELDDIEMGDDAEEVDRDAIMHELRDLRYTIDSIEGYL